MLIFLFKFLAMKKPGNFKMMGATTKEEGEHASIDEDVFII